MSYTQDAREVKRLTKAIDKAEGDLDAWKWDRAEVLARMCEAKPQREVAADVGMSHRNVGIIVKIWKARLGKAAFQGSYSALYYEMQGKGSGFGASVRTPAERAKAAKDLMAEPEVRRAVVEDPKVRGAVFNDILKAEGQTRDRVPKDDRADRVFGPFVKLNLAMSNLARALPDYPPEEYVEHAEDTLNKLRATVEIVEAWMKGGSVADEVEQFLKEGA